MKVDVESRRESMWTGGQVLPSLHALKSAVVGVVVGAVVLGVEVSDVVVIVVEKIVVVV